MIGPDLTLRPKEIKNLPPAPCLAPEKSSLLRGKLFKILELGEKHK